MVNTIQSGLFGLDSHQAARDTHDVSAITKTFVSYIYYPSQRETFIVGHAELEIEGYSWSLMYPETPKNLSDMIYVSTQGNGFPFFRFKISVTPEQLIEMREKGKYNMGLTCSHGVFNALSKYGGYTVPLPISLSPTLSAAYLAGAKALGSNKVGSIKFYCGSNPLVNLAKCVAGVAFESITIVVLSLSGLKAMSSLISRFT